MATLTVNTTLADDSVTNAKLANMLEGTIKGVRYTGGNNSNDPEDLDADRVSVILDTAADPFVRTSALPADTGITQLTGDVTAGPGSGSQTATIANQAVTFDKMQHISTAHLLGRHGAGTGDVQQIGIDGGLELQGSNLRRAALTGDVTASAGNNSTTIANNAVSNEKLADMAEATIKGRAAAAGTGDPQDLTASEARTALGIQSGALIDVTVQFITYTGGSQANSTLTPANIDDSANLNIPGAGLYYFEFSIQYTAAATTTGAMFDLGGSTVAQTYLAYTVYGDVGTGDRGTAQWDSYTPDFPFASSRTTGAGALRGKIEGMIQAAGSGVIRIRFRSEVNASAITITDVKGFYQRRA